MGKEENARIFSFYNSVFYPTKQQCMKLKIATILAEMIQLLPHLQRGPYHDFFQALDGFLQTSVNPALDPVAYSLSSMISYL